MLMEDCKRATLYFNKFYWVDLRRILWKHRISPSEFFSYMTKLLVTGDQRIHIIVNELKIQRAEGEVLDIVHTDDESLYSLIEQRRNKKEE